ncbi:MAG: threonine--tRNA ligase [Nitrospirota bacterium]|jgi:threonyl-tRNA synthetase
MQVEVTLPDGTTKTYGQPVTVQQVAESIGAGLARAAIGARVDGRPVDLSTELQGSVSLEILTERSPDALEVLRHSTAHLLAHAVKHLYPEAQFGVGPAIDNGFYYDIDIDTRLHPEDLEEIEAEMHRIAEQDLPVERREFSRDEAIAEFRRVGDGYKVEIIEGIDEGDTISAYGQGDFIDLCRGPHVPTTGRLRFFKLQSIAGAYWRGSEQNKQLQRIYGTAFFSKKALDEHLHLLEEAKRRDHRRLGRELDLFHLQEEAPGMVFWHPNGTQIWRAVESYIRELIRGRGYQEIRTPMIVDRSLWERSGHWDKFREEMFTTESEAREFAVKPMNCPCHIQVFNQAVRSYKDLPMRLAEFGSCHRNEPSGTLHGLMRARNFVQDDAHIFCTEDQIGAEVIAFNELVFEVYETFGFGTPLVKFADRPEKRVGSDAVWDRAEAALREALDSSGAEYEMNPGEGAFYGPKIEFSLKDSLGRVWQCGTIQVDFSMPERLGATYVGEDNQRHTPVMLHRAILGSIERFIAVLIEHYGGALPPWLAPVQAIVLPISERHREYAETVCRRLDEAGLRATVDRRDEKVGAKIRDAQLRKIPYMLIVGDREAESASAALRTRSDGDQGTMDMTVITDRIRTAVATRSAEL